MIDTQETERAYTLWLMIAHLQDFLWDHYGDAFLDIDEVNNIDSQQHLYNDDLLDE